MDKKVKFFLLGLVIALAVLSVSVAAADWPNFRNGASNSGDASETINLPLTEKWHSSAPDVEENGAVVANGIVYMNTEDGKLYAFTVATGDMVPGFPVTIGGSFSTPAVDSANQKVYALTGNGLQAFNLDGSPAWTKAVGGTGTNYNEGPIVDAGFLYAKAGGFLYKYDSSGNLQWSSPTTGMSTQPAIMDNYVYVNSESGQIRKYDKATGAEVTTGGFPISTAATQASLAAVDGKLFIKSNLVYAYDADDGSTLWSAAAGGDATYGDSPAVSNGVVYVYGYTDSMIYAFDANTGAAMAGFPSVALNTPGRNWNSPAVAGDKIFIGAGTSQKLKVLGAAGSAQAGQVLEEHLAFSTDTQGFDLCSPVISDGVVFAMLDGGGLYAYFDSDTEWTGGAIKINDGSECTDSPDVTLSLDKGNNPLVNEMRISEDPFFAGAVWEPFAATKTWTLSPGFGTKTVYVQFRDSNGLLSNVFNDQIDYSESCSVVTQCSDGIDNDGDDLIDMADPGCSAPGDNDERDGTAIPEFPSVVLPVAMIIGIGAVMLIFKAREY